MPTTVGVVILLVSTVAAVLSGIAVFTNVRPERPDDPRIGLIFDSIEETKSMLNQAQKTLLTIEHRLEKDIKDFRGEMNDLFLKVHEAIDKILQEHAQ
ncbi:MAG: hypothetical protein FWG12_03295 [Holophagaceae bacterium]|nr:hypothetical protein [Holophagaceae bacterium]